MFNIHSTGLEENSLGLEMYQMKKGLGWAKQLRAILPSLVLLPVVSQLACFYLFCLVLFRFFFFFLLLCFSYLFYSFLFLFFATTPMLPDWTWSRFLKKFIYLFIYFKHLVYLEFIQAFLEIILKSEKKTKLKAPTTSCFSFLFFFLYILK